jgi:MoaA/NifB/PqqE/SkfB family radical SAM enzyme
MIIVKKDLVKHLFYGVYRHLYTHIFWSFPKMVSKIKYPHIIGLELTNDCNLKCVHCFRNRMNEDIGYLSMEVFKKLVDEISTYPVSFLRIVGRGEPALHPQLREIMDYLKGKPIKIEFCTNGLIFEKYSYKDILDWNIDLLDISIDGVDQISYNKLRKNGDYHRLKTNIANFFYTRNINNRTSPKIIIRNVLYPHIEKYQIRAFKSDWLEIADLVCFNELFPINRTFIYEEFLQCKSILFNAHIRWNGCVSMCHNQFMFADERYFGNLQHKELKDIWTDDRFIELRLAHQCCDFTNFPECTQCFPIHNKKRRIEDKLFVIPKTKLETEN